VVWYLPPLPRKHPPPKTHVVSLGVTYLTRRGREYGTRVSLSDTSSGVRSACNTLLIRKSKSACRWRCVEVDFRHSFMIRTSRRPLAGLWDCPVTWELKNIPPLAAVENIGQWAEAWTSTTRKMKGRCGREGYESCKVCPRTKKMTLRSLESRAKKVPAAAVIP